MITVLLAVILYVAVAIFVVGMIWRLSQWFKRPVPLNIVLTPGPKTNLGVTRRLAEQLLGFRALAKADWSLWTPAWLFHFSLFLLFVGHFGGLVIPTLAESSLGLSTPQFENLAQVTGLVVGLLAIVSLLWLLLRRLTLQRVRWISKFSDYFALVLLLLVIGTGDEMRFMGGLNIIRAQEFVAGWLTLHPKTSPADLVFYFHVLLVCTLLIYIPFSKLVHIGGAALFSPTLNQRNNPREYRHVNTWDNANEHSAA